MMAAEQQELAQLRAMGFDPEQAARALELCDNQLDQAAELLADWAAAPPPTPATEPPTAPEPPAAAAAPTTLSRPERLEADVAALAALASEPASRYHSLLAPLCEQARLPPHLRSKLPEPAWEAPRLRLRTTDGTVCHLTFDPDEYPHGGGEFTDHPGFASLPPPDTRAPSSRVAQLVDLLLFAPSSAASGEPQPEPQPEQAGEEEDDEDEGSSIASDDELFRLASGGSSTTDGDDALSPWPSGGTDGSAQHDDLAQLEKDAAETAQLARTLAEVTSCAGRPAVVLSLGLADIVARATRSAWKLHPELPLLVRVILSEHYTAAVQAPAPADVIVYQTLDASGAPQPLERLGYQLHNLTHRFVSEWWADKSDAAVVESFSQWPARSVGCRLRAGELPPDVLSDAGTRLQRQRSSGGPSHATSGRGVATERGGKPAWEDEENVQRVLGELQALGVAVGRAGAIGALSLAASDHMDMEAVIDVFFEDPAACTAAAAQLAPPEPEPEPELEPEPEPEAASEPQENLLLDLATYLRFRVPSLHKRCVICDQPHTFAGAGLVPAVCSREACLFTFQHCRTRHFLDRSDYTFN